MKALQYLFLLVSASLMVAACEDDIFPELENAPPQVVIDAWINDKDEDQVITITATQSYYDSSTPPAITDATVYILDETGKRYDFAGGTEGKYVWSPTNQDPTFGAIGLDYQLFVETQGGEVFTATSEMNRVPEIDSVRFRFEEAFGPFPESYFGEFFALDPPGPGDTYWIKAYKNGEYLNKPSEISLAYDAGFTAGGNVDGIVFIQPIRDSVNPFDQDEEDNFLPPYEIGDSLYVEIYSITNEAFDFLTEVQIQIDRPGGFGELFATPLSNVPTNISRTVDTEGVPPLGFFNVSAVSGRGNRLVED